MTAVLIFWAVMATLCAGFLHAALKVQQAHIELLEDELKFAESEIESMSNKQKFQPQNRVFGGKPR